MKSLEFISEATENYRANINMDGIDDSPEFVDIWAIQEEEIRNRLLENPKLFEGTADYKELGDFLSLHKTNNVKVGKKYVYASVMSMLPGHMLSLSYFNTPVQLVELRNNYAYFYINGRSKQFPEGETLSGDLLKATFMFNTVEEAERFGDWNLKTKTIDTSI